MPRIADRLIAQAHGRFVGRASELALLHQTFLLLPLIERTGITTAAEVDVDTLAERLQTQALANDATLVSPAHVGAWVCLPEL